MQVGDRVITKSLSVPVIGTVVMITQAEYYFAKMPKAQGMEALFGGRDPYQDYLIHKEKFPDMKNMCMVVFDQPIRGVSAQDLSSDVPEWSEMQYLLQRPMYECMYPDTDLDILPEVANIDKKIIQFKKEAFKKPRMEGEQEESYPPEQEDLY